MQISEADHEKAFQNTNESNPVNTLVKKIREIRFLEKFSTRIPRKSILKYQSSKVTN